MSDIADITIIGAGVVGLAIAAQVARRDKEVYVLEKNGTFGQESSSRNSGIVNSGIYYPLNSLRRELCIAGNQILGEIAGRNEIGYKKLGKLTVATNEDEAKELQMLFEGDRRNGVKDSRMLSRQEIKELEPDIEGMAALLSPSTAIIDPHGLMKYFKDKAQGEGAQIVYKTEVIGIKKQASGYRVAVENGAGGYSFLTKIIINCAGLNCSKMAELAGIDIAKAGYRLHYCKGEYFNLKSNRGRSIRRVIYPAPSTRRTGSGMRITPVMDGRMRLGPNAFYVDKIDYSVNSGHKQGFYDSTRKILPWIDYEDLEPEMAGIRPKLGGGFRDFIIQDECKKGLPGFINLIGIESSGLTASPGIARYVANLIEQRYLLK